MTTTSADTELQAGTVTLDDRRQAFNLAYQTRHGASSGMGTMAVSSIPPLFVPNAIMLEHTADIGINRALVQPAPQGLLVEVQAYPDMQAGDVIEIFLHAQSLATAPAPVKTATLGVGREGLNIALYVPEQSVEQGELYLYSRVHRAGTSEVEESPQLTVWCKLSLPAGPDLVPNEPWHSGLHAPRMLECINAQNLGDFVQVSVEPYLDMAAGDLVRLYFGLEQLDYEVLPQDIGQVMAVHVPADVLYRAGDSEALALYYRVIDPLGNVSEKGSARTFVHVSLQNALLQAPWVLDENAPQVLDSRDPGSEDVALSVRARPTPAQPGDVLVQDGALVQPGDVLEVVGNGIGALGQPVEFRPPNQSVVDPDAVYTFGLDNALVQRLARGLLMVSYKVRRGMTYVWQSQRRYIDVMGRAPELPGPVVTEAKHDVLAPTLPRCTVTISYSSMAMGDWVELFFRGLTSAGYAYAWQVGRSVSRNDALRQTLTFTVPGQHIAALDGGALQPRYQVSNEWLPTPLESSRPWVQVGESPAELAAPVVPAAGADGRLAQTDIGIGVDVMVPADPLIRPGSTVSVQWLGENAAASCEGEADAFVYRVAPAVAHASVGQSVVVTYAVRHAQDGRVRRSLPFTLWVIPQVPVVLRAPVALDMAGALDPTVLPMGARFQAAYQGIVTGDEVVMTLTGKQAYSSPALRVEPQKPWVITLPHHVLLANAGGMIQLTYTVKREGQPVRLSPPLNLEVLNALGIVSSRLELNGLSIKVEGWIPNREVSVGNTATRVASGGQAPYTYTSNNSTVASVTATGLVTGNRNGQAVITATDRRGSNVTYPVQVNNVYRLVHNWGPVNHNQAVAWMKSLGNAEPCNARAVADLQRVYGSKLKTGDYWHFWLCEKNGCGGSGFAFYHATNQAVFCADYFNTNIHAAWCIQRT